MLLLHNPIIAGFILTLVQLMSDVVLSALTVNCSVLLGAIISWGFLWPYISQLAGHWYPADLGSNDFKGLYGCKVFTAISLILGDGLYNLIKIITITIKELCNTPKQKNLPVVNEVSDEIFLKDRIPSWLAVSGYLVLAAISTATIPSIFPPLKWYLVLCSYVLVPALAFCNSYGTGLTDWSLASTYGKIGLFVISSLVGRDGGVIACLAACGVMMSIVSTAADLMQDFKTGYLTLSSAKSMFVSQLIGTAMGCVLAPLTFWLFWTAFDVGSPDGPYKAPYAVIFREMAILGIEGFSELPKHCLALCCGFFVAALVINLLRDVSPTKVSQFIPIPMAMAVPFYIGAYFAIDMFVGTVILYVWEQLNRKGAEDYAGAVASGLICGDGIWTIPSAILSIFRINPPICMYFRPSVSSNMNGPDHFESYGVVFGGASIITDVDSPFLCKDARDRTDEMAPDRDQIGLGCKEKKKVIEEARNRLSQPPANKKMRILQWFARGHSDDQVNFGNATTNLGNAAITSANMTCLRGISADISKAP
ncbi:hypothetical protein HYC85_005862 [Camellia sinensis]|uniref:Metal-nicotianamine transporter YSL6 n=1 Tax=Camellia sinensis TaxID=4442 RepID=A0A7J7I1U8_CAMSI|nr:hypothetical protein HYC85_005862 [Camellia sinensis]